MGFVACGAKTRAGTPCRIPAGRGTDHPGTGRCKLHGGASHGGKPGNKNALRTGEYETIWRDQLDAEEQELYERVNTDVLAQLDEEIRLATIRERRMLRRIAELGETGMTEVSKSKELGLGPEGPIDKVTTKSEGALGQVQRIEEALTRVQAAKTRLLELRDKLSRGDDDDTVDALVAALAASRRKRAERDAV